MSAGSPLPFPTVDKSKPPPRRRDWLPVLGLGALSLYASLSWSLPPGSKSLWPPPLGLVLAIVCWVGAWWWMERRVDNRFTAQKLVGRLAVAGLALLIGLSIWSQMVQIAGGLPNP